MRKVSRSWSIPLSSLCDHLNKHMCSRKMGPRGVLRDGENVVVIVV